MPTLRHNGAQTHVTLAMARKLFGDGVYETLDPKVFACGAECLGLKTTKNHARASHHTYMYTRVVMRAQILARAQICISARKTARARFLSKKNAFGDKIVWKTLLSLLKKPY